VNCPYDFMNVAEPKKSELKLRREALTAAKQNN
jgi:hypothetical protein